MDPKKLQYIIELLKKGDGAKEATVELEKLQQQGKKTGDSLGELKSQAEKAALAIGSALAIRSAVSAYADYSKVSNEVSAALKAHNQYSAEYRNELQLQAEAQEDATKIDEERLMEMQKILIAFKVQRQEMPAVTEAVLDLSAAMGTDVASGAMAFSRAMEGADQQLVKLGYHFDDNASRSERMAAFIDQTREKFGGLSRAMENTPVGKLKSMEDAVGDLRREVGRLVTTSLMPAIEFTTKAAKATQDFLKEGSTASEYTKELVSVGVQTGLLVTAANYAGKAYESAFAGGIKGAGGLRAAIGSIPKTVAIALAISGGKEIFDLYQEMNGYGRDARTANDSRASREDTNDNLRGKVESELLKGLAGGQIDILQYLLTSSSITHAFEDSANSPLRRLYQDKTGQVRTATRADRDLDAESRSIRNAQGLLNPMQPGAQKELELIAEQKKAIEELNKLDEEAHQSTLDSFAKERGEAAQNYREQVQHISDLVRKNELSAEEKQKHISVQDEAYIQKLAAIEERENSEKEERARRLQQLKDQLLEKGLEGLQKEMAMEDNRYQRAIENINKQKDATEAEKKALLDLNEKVHQQVIKSFDAARPADAIREFETQLTEQFAGSSKTRTEIAREEYEARVAFYAELKNQVQITEAGMTRLVEEAAAKRAQADAAAVNAGREDVERIAAERSGGSFGVAALEADHAYEIRKQNVAAYYEFVQRQAQTSEEEFYRLEEQKTRDLETLNKQKLEATNELYLGMKQIAQSAAQHFASGLSNAFLDFASGVKDADEAFKEFAANFLRSIADMIMQLVIMIALKAALKGMGFGLADGGMVAAAKGGMFPVTAAAAGVMLAAAGVQGVSEVNGPTYFPKFNVLAGEAGREVMTVMAKPQMANVGGMPVMLGNVGPDRLAMLSQDSLSALVNGSGNATRAAAGAIMGGSLTPLSSPIAGSSGSGSNDRRSELLVTLSPELKAELVHQSIEGARVAVATDLGTDTPIRQQAKGVMS